jgi:hypothetical protein
MAGQIACFDAPMPINGNQNGEGDYANPTPVLLEELSEN